MATRSTLYAITISEDLNTVTLAAGGRTLAVDVPRLPQEILDRAICDSIADTLRDCFAGSNVQPNPAAWGFDRADARVQAFMDGVWTSRGEGGPAAPTVLAEALHRERPSFFPTAADAQRAIDGYTDGETVKEAWSDAKKKAARKLLDKIIRQINLERAQARAEKPATVPETVDGLTLEDLA